MGCLSWDALAQKTTTSSPPGRTRCQLQARSCLGPEADVAPKKVWFAGDVELSSGLRFGEGGDQHPVMQGARRPNRQVRGPGRVDTAKMTKSRRRGWHCA